MGVKWTCALFCLLGIAFIQIEAASTLRHASITNRSKRDVKDVVENTHYSSSSGSPGGSSFSSSSSSSSSSGGGGTSFSSSAPGPSIGSRVSVPAAENVPFYSGTQAVPYAGAPQNFAPPRNVGQQSWPSPAQNQNFGYDPNFNNVRNVGSQPYYPDQNAALQASAFNFQNFLQQYIRTLQAQQELFNSQFLGQGQTRVKSGSGSWAHAAAFTTGSNGVVHPNAMVYTHVSTGGSNGGTGHSRHYYSLQSNQAVKNQQRSFGQNNRLDNGSPFNHYPNNFGVGNRGQFGNNVPTFPSYNQNQQFPNSVGGGFSNSFGQPQTAFASSAIGPGGGFQKAEVSPASPGITSRFAETIPASNGGNTFSAFSSTHSETHQDPDGVIRSHKTATTGTNDNGKVSVHTVHDP